MPKILLVDDAEEFRFLAAQFLSLEWPDIEVTDWDPPAQGEIPAEYPLKNYDALLLDYQLGAGDGLAWLKSLTRRADCPPIVFLTGAGDENVVVKAMKGGAFDYLSKQNLTKASLIESVRAAIAERTVHTPSSRQPRPEANQQLAKDRLAATTVSLKIGSNPVQEVAIDGYRVVEKIGAGGMSTVYLAERTSDNMRLVMKIMDAKLAEKNEYLQRFIQEYGLISKIESPFVVRIFDQGFTDRHVYIAMEHFAGGDLRARIGKKLDPAEALQILQEIARALAAVHAHGIVHRDLKPDNVMFRADGSLAIVDFGIAKQNAGGANLTAHGDVLGTPHYLSPEQACAQPLDGRSDLYSLGILFFEMLTGRRPFHADDALGIALKHVNEPMPRLPEAFARFQELVDGLTAKQREDRFSSADELLAFLTNRTAALASDAAEPPLIDAVRLHELKADFQNLPGAFENLLGKFRDSVENQVVLIKSAFAARDAGKLRFVAHSLKGSAASFGAQRLNELAAEIERRALAEDISHADDLIARTVACGSQTLKELAILPGVMK